MGTEQGTVKKIGRKIYSQHACPQNFILSLTINAYAVPSVILTCTFYLFFFIFFIFHFTLESYYSFELSNDRITWKRQVFDPGTLSLADQPSSPTI